MAMNDTHDAPESEYIPDEFENDEATAKDKIKELRGKLKEAEVAKAQALEDLQRAKADFLNSRKRLEEERARDRQRQTVEFIETLLPLCDSFSMAMSNKETWESIDKNWRSGVEGIYAQLQSILKDYGVTAITQTDVPFDPHRHEAVASVPVATPEEHQRVVSIVQAGYERTHDSSTELIRPARVTVGEFTQA